MKQIRYWIVLCCLTILLCVEVFGQSTVTAALTVQCLNAGGVVLTEPLKDAPEPDSTRLILKAGEEKQILFQFSEPGIYRYRVLETEDSRDTVLRDDTVYYVIFYVYTTEEGKLYSKTTVSAGKSVNKSGSVTFQNIPRESRTRKESETSRKKRSSEKKGFVRTGDPFHWYLWAGLFILSAAVMVFLLKKSQKMYRKDMGEKVADDEK